MDNFIEEHRAVTVQANQETNIVESSLNKELDVFQSEIDQEFDILQQSVSKLTNQLVHQEEENLEEECILGEQAQMQPQGELMQEPLEAPEELPAREVGEEHQRLTLQPIPINLDPNATAKPKKVPFQCTYCLPLQHNLHLKDLPQRPPNVLCLPCKTPRH